MEKLCIAILGFMVFAANPAFSACPSIEGNWAYAFDEVYIGDTYAGFGLAEISVDKMTVRTREGWRGEHAAATLTGKYIVQPNCMIRWNYTIKDADLGGVVHGVIVSTDKMFLMYSNVTAGKTGRVIAERIKY